MLRTSGGYAGWTDEQLLGIPYARLMQAARVASEQVEAQHKDEWRRTAFVAWHALAGGLAGGSIPSIEEYLDAMGLGTSEEVTLAGIERDKQRARDVMARARVAFARGGAPA